MTDKEEITEILKDFPISEEERQYIIKWGNITWSYTGFTPRRTFEIYVPQILKPEIFIKEKWGIKEKSGHA